MNLAPEDVVVAAPDQVWTSLGEDTAILHLRSSTYYALRGTGPRIWELLQQPVSVDSIVRTLVREFDVAHARCEADVLALLRSLAAVGLVQRGAPAPK